jgi:predicted nucleotidyltransferase
VIEALLDAHARAVMDRVIAEEEQRRRHLVIALSGAHAYGFPSPDSDLDLKSIHVGSAKKLLYVLRTALTGAHALRTGRIVIDLGELAEGHGFGAARELIEAKRAGERVTLEAGAAARWEGEVQRALAALTEAHDKSILPVEPEGAADLEAWLLEQRRKRL